MRGNLCIVAVVVVVCSCDDGRSPVESPIWGAKIDFDRNCLRDAIVLERKRGSTKCGGTITYAADPKGVCYQFPSTCIPQGFAEDDACVPPGDPLPCSSANPGPATIDDAGAD